MNKSGIQNSAFLKHSLKNFLIRLREYKKNFAANGVSELEDLITHVLEDPIVSYETIEKIISIKDSNEKVDIAILNFLTKLFRDFVIPELIMTRQKSHPLEIEKIITNTFKILENPSIEEYSYMKKLEFIRASFQAMSLESIDCFVDLWKILKRLTANDKSFVREVAKDYSAVVIKDHFNRINYMIADEMIPVPEQKIVEFCLSELLRDWKRLALEYKAEKDALLRVEILKQLEGNASTLLFSLEAISTKDLTFLQGFLQNELIYGILHLADIDDNSIIALCISYCEYIWKHFSKLEKTCIFSTLVFGQTLLKPLKRLYKKLKAQNEMTFRDFVDFRNLSSFLSSFIENKALMRKLFLQNDLHPFNAPVIDEVMKRVFKISKRVMANSISPYIVEVTQVFTTFCAKILDFEDSQSHLLQNVPAHEKATFDNYLKMVHRWDKLAVLANTEPKKFITQAPSEFYIKETLEEKSHKIAAFLLLSHRVDSMKIIEVLGPDKPLNNMIREEFVKLFNLKNKSMIVALRYFCINFLLLAESQVIARIIECFTNFYHSQNPGSVFKSTDALYVFIYSVIMLNTDQYKPGLQERMTFEQFKHNSTKINDGENLPDQVLEECYNSIKTQEIKYFGGKHHGDRALQFEENVYEEAWQLFLELNEYKQSHLLEILPQGEKFNPAEIEALENFNILIDSQYSKMIITKLTENIEMIVVRSKGDTGLIETLIEKIINACVSYGMLENLDNLLKHLESGFELKVPLDYTTLNEKTSWNFICMLIAAKKAFLYLDDSMRVMAKLIIGSYKYRHRILKEPIAIYYELLYRKIRESSKFLAQARHSNASFFDKLSSFLDKDDSSSEDETTTKLRKWEYVSKTTVDKLQTFGSYFQNTNYLEEIFEQTKYLPDEKLLNLYEISLEIITSVTDLSKDITSLYSFIVFLYEITMRNRDRVHQLWRKYTRIMNVMLKINHPQEKEALVGFEDEPLLVTLYEKLGAFKKSKQKSFNVIQNCIRFLMLESSIKLLDKSKHLEYFDKYFKDAVEFLEFCSLPLVDETLGVFASVINSIKMEQTESSLYVLKFLSELVKILSQKNLERPDVKITCLRTNELVNDFLVKVVFHPELKSGNFCKEVVSFLEFYTNSNFCKKYELGGTIISSVTMLFTEVMNIQQLHSKDNLQNRLIQLILKLLVSLDSKSIVSNFKTVQKAIGSIELNTIQISDVLLICDSMWKLDTKLLESNDEHIITSYLETSCKIFLNFVELLYDQNKLSAQWFKLLTKIVETYKFARGKKMNNLMESLVGHLLNTLQIMISLEFLSLTAPTADLDEHRRDKQEQAMKLWKESVPYLQGLPKEILKSILTQLNDTTQAKNTGGSKDDVSPVAHGKSGEGQAIKLEGSPLQPQDPQSKQESSPEVKLDLTPKSSSPLEEVKTQEFENGQTAELTVTTQKVPTSTEDNSPPKNQTDAKSPALQKKLEELQKGNVTMML